MCPRVLVGIPFRNQSRLLIECLNSLLITTNNGFKYGILIVDDKSDQDEFDYVVSKNPFGEYIQILRNDTNLGYTQTVHNIVEYAKSNNIYDYLLLCNSDIVFFKDTIYNLTCRIRQSSRFSTIGCKVLHWNNDKIIHTGTRVKNNDIVNPYCGLNKDDDKTLHVERRLWVNGCCVLYDLDILRKENLNFDLNFSPAYFEESDLMTRLNILGYAVIYEPQAMIRHVVNATTRNYKEYSKVFSKNWNEYLRKWKKYFKYFEE